MPEPGSDPVHRPTVLIVDDEEMIRSLLTDILSDEGFRTVEAADGQAALAVLEQQGPNAFDFIITDLRMPRLDGMEFVRKAVAAGTTAPIIIISAYADVETAVHAIQAGAFDYIAKPLQRDDLLFTLRKAAEVRRLRRENRVLKRAFRSEFRLDNVVAESPKMKAVVGTLRRVANYRSTALFQGETGAGKETLARALHCLSDRGEGPFVRVGCYTLSASKLEEELFGREADATVPGVPGALEEASGGSILLEEIHHLPEPLQLRLLHTLQDGTVRRVGSRTATRVDVRVLASCSFDLKEEVAEGRFREELYYRLNVVPVTIPPLRERHDDIIPLAERIIARFAKDTGRPLLRISPEATEMLLRHPWRGNVRELDNAIEHAMIMAEGDTIRPEDFAPLLPEIGRRGALSIGPEEYSVKKVVARVEEELIRRALRKTGGNRTEASTLLEISSRTLQYKIKDYGIQL